MGKFLISFMLIGAFQLSSPAWACGDLRDEPKKDAAIETVQGLLLAAGNSCLSSADCVAGENCIRGTCQLSGGAGSCLTDVDCALGEHCVAGNCRR